MKRKYWVEAFIASLVLCVLLIVMVPHFKRAQVKAQVAGLKLYVSDAVKLCVDAGTSNFLPNLRGIVSPGFSGPLTKRGIGRVDLYLSGEEYFTESDAFENAFAILGESPWIASDHAFAVSKTHSRKTTEHKSSFFESSDYEDQPFVISIMAVVGDKRTWSSGRLHFAPYNVDIDNEGYLKILSHFIPYDTSNGLTSYGEFYADTTSLLPRKKAVVMDPPPETQP